MKLIYHPNNWLEKKVKPFDFDTNDANEVRPPALVITEDIDSIKSSNVIVPGELTSPLTSKVTISLILGSL